MAFTKNVFWTFITRMAILALGLISGVVVARVFGQEGKGIFAAIGMLVGIATQFGNLGIANAMTYFVARDPKMSKRLSGNAIWFGLGWGSILAFGFYLFEHFSPGTLFGSIDPRFLYITLISIPFLLIAQFFQYIVLGKQYIAWYNGVQWFNQVLIVLGTLLLVFLWKTSLVPIIIFSTFIGIATAFLYGALLWKRGDFGLSSDTQLFLASLRYGFRGFLANLLTFLIFRADLYLVNTFLGVKELGVYSLASNMGDYLMMFPIAVGTMLFPKISGEEKEKAIVWTEKIYRSTAVIMFFICLAMALLARPLIILLYGPAFETSVVPLLIILPGIFFWSLSSLLMNYFAGRGNPLIIICSPLAALILNLILNIIYIPRFGIMAAAVSSTIAYFLTFSLNLIYFVKKERSSLKNLFLIQKQDVQTIVTFFKKTIPFLHYGSSKESL